MLDRLEKVDYIIVGQGLAGSLLSFELLKRGYTIKVIDNDHKLSSSSVAAGFINPITGRKYVKSWNIEKLLPVALSVYDEIAQTYKVKTYEAKKIFRVLFTPEDENTWLSRSADPLASQFIQDPADPSEVMPFIKNAPAYGQLKQGYMVKFPVIMNAVRKALKKQDALINAEFDFDQLQLNEVTVEYQGIKAKKMIFCEGHQVLKNPFFNYIPWQPVKGEVLIIRIPGVPFKQIVRHKIFVAHLQDDLYWVGSGYQNQFKSHLPTPEGRQRLIEQLEAVLIPEYEIVDHLAGIRPAVSGRKPVVGQHPRHKPLFIFNGLGTKGGSLGPYYVRQLVDSLTTGSPLDLEVTRLL